MTDPEIPYITREVVQRELGYADSVRLNKRIDAKILQSSREVESLCHRRFYPWTGTRTFDVPETDTLWLHENELSEITAIDSGGTAMTGDDYIAQPASGPPYRWLDIRWSGSVGWEAGDTWQRSIAITGTYHHPVATKVDSFTNGEVATDDTTLALDADSDIGVGSLILIGSERMLVTEKELTLAGATLAADLAASKGQSLVPVTNPGVFGIGEVILIGAERMLIEQISGDNLIVARGYSASTLAEHTTGDFIAAPRLATVRRGILGTSVAAHASDATITLLQAPSLVQEATLALTVTALEQGSSGYGRTVGSGDNQREAAGRGVKTILDAVYSAYGRKARGRAV